MRFTGKVISLKNNSVGYLTEEKEMEERQRFIQLNISILARNRIN